MSCDDDDSEQNIYFVYLMVAIVDIRRNFWTWWRGCSKPWPSNKQPLTKLVSNSCRSGTIKTSRRCAKLSDIRRIFWPSCAPGIWGASPRFVFVSIYASRSLRRRGSTLGCSIENMYPPGSGGLRLRGVLGCTCLGPYLPLAKFLWKPHICWFTWTFIKLKRFWL